MANLIFRQEALDDLSSIWIYTANEWSENQADYYYESIKQTCLRLAGERNSGKSYSQINKNLLGIRFGKHIIFYTLPNDKEIEIVRILH